MKREVDANRQIEIGNLLDTFTDAHRKQPAAKC